VRLRICSSRSRGREGTRLRPATWPGHRPDAPRAWVSRGKLSSSKQACLRARASPKLAECRDLSEQGYMSDAGFAGDTPCQPRHARGCTKPPASHSGIKTSPNPALRPHSSPDSTTAPHNRAANPQPPALLAAQHPRGCGTQNRALSAPCTRAGFGGRVRKHRLTGRVVTADARKGAEDTGEGRKREPSLEKDRALREQYRGKRSTVHTPRWLRGKCA